MLNNQHAMTLFKQGLREAKQFSGMIWTDHHLHDPGITILEQVVKATVKQQQAIDTFQQTSLPLQQALLRIPKKSLYHWNDRLALLRQWQEIHEAWYVNNCLFLLPERGQDKQILHKKINVWLTQNRILCSLPPKIKIISSQEIALPFQLSNQKYQQFNELLYQWNKTWLIKKKSINDFWREIEKVIIFPEHFNQPIFRLASDQVIALPMSYQVKAVDEVIETTFAQPIEYDSIQKKFPSVYGLRKGEISESNTVEKHASAKQLHGYLLMIEQDLANIDCHLNHWMSIQKGELPEPIIPFKTPEYLLNRNILTTKIGEHKQRVFQQGYRHDDYLNRWHEIANFISFWHGEDHKTLETIYPAWQSILIKRALISQAPLLLKRRGLGRDINQINSHCSLALRLNILLANQAGHPLKEGLSLEWQASKGWRWCVQTLELTLYSIWVEQPSEVNLLRTRLVDSASFHLAKDNQAIHVFDQQGVLLAGEMKQVTRQNIKAFKKWVKQPCLKEILVVEGIFLNAKQGPWPDLIIVLPMALKDKSLLLYQQLHAHVHSATEVALCWLEEQDLAQFHQRWQQFLQSPELLSIRDQLSLWLKKIQTSQLDENSMSSTTEGIKHD